MAYVRDENGRLKKTVRCSYCYGTGHSRRTCPELHPNGTPAQQRAKAREAEKAQRKLEREQRKQDKAAGKEVTKITRKCGYCGEQGHSRRHCEVLAADKARLAEITLDYRRKLAKEVTDQGIGKGALVVSKTMRWSNKAEAHVPMMHYATITKTDFEGLSPFSNWAVSKRDMFTYGDEHRLTMLSLTGDSYNRLGQTNKEGMLNSGEGCFSLQAGSLYSQRQGRKGCVVVPGEVSLPDGFLDEGAIAAEIDEYFSNTTKTREHYNILDRVKYNDTYGNQ